jgi:hypothetical protein
MTDSTNLSSPELSKLSDLITDSVIQRYDGDLQRHEHPATAEIIYLPCDVNRIHDLLTSLWGSLVNAMLLDTVFDQLNEDGAKNWPNCS